MTRSWMSRMIPRGPGAATRPHGATPPHSSRQHAARQRGAGRMSLQHGVGPRGGKVGGTASGKGMRRGVRGVRGVMSVSPGVRGVSLGVRGVAGAV